MTEGAMPLSAADVAAVTRNNDYDGFGSGGWMWIILLAFLFRGNWGGYGNGESPLVSEEFIKRDIFNTNQNVSTTACQTQRDVLENRYTTQLGLQQLGAQQQQCCCDTGEKILESRYTTQLGFQGLSAQLAQCCCDITTALHAEGEATRGLMRDQETARLRDELDQARGIISNTSQSQYILGQLGRFGLFAPAWNNFGCNNGCGC